MSSITLHSNFFFARAMVGRAFATPVIYAA